MGQSERKTLPKAKYGEKITEINKPRLVEI